LELFGEGQWVSKQFEPTGASGTFVWNSGYTTVNAGATYRLFQRYGFIQSVDLWTRIQNLTNEDYSEVRGFPALGINALVGARMTLQTSPGCRMTVSVGPSSGSLVTRTEG